MDAPYSETARSKLSSGSGTASALASSSGNSRPKRSCISRAVASWAGVTSTPTGRAPRRASQAETYAVPQPSSTTSRPSTESGSTRASDSGMPQTPQVISSEAHARGASSAYSGAQDVHSSRLRRA